MDDERRIDLMEERIKEIRADIRCMHDTFKVYEVYLREAKGVHESWAKIKQSIVATTITAIVGGVVVGVLGLIWHGAGYVLKYGIK